MTDEYGLRPELASAAWRAAATAVVSRTLSVHNVNELGGEWGTDLNDVEETRTRSS